MRVKNAAIKTGETSASMTPGAAGGGPGTDVTGDRHRWCGRTRVFRNATSIETFALHSDDFYGRRKHKASGQLLGNAIRLRCSLAGISNTCCSYNIYKMYKRCNGDGPV